jgi:hypothetical protein
MKKKLKKKEDVAKNQCYADDVLQVFWKEFRQHTSKP